MAVSIIVPTLNEATVLERTLRNLRALHPAAHEVILVDGRSSDATARIAQTFGAKVILAAPGRAGQMNLGARAASGDVLCFVHADTLVPDDLVPVIESTLRDPAIACGGFISLMTGPKKVRWGISLHNFLKTYYAPLLFRPHLFLRGARLLFGDQVIFCRRSDFLAIGGFDPDMPIMEEADFCIKISKLGRITQLNRVVHSSDRRVSRWGPWKANAIYLYIGVLWGVGVSPAFLKKAYADIR